MTTLQMRLHFHSNWRPPAPLEFRITVDTSRGAPRESGTDVRVPGLNGLAVAPVKRITWSECSNYQHMRDVFFTSIWFIDGHGIGDVCPQMNLERVLCVHVCRFNIYLDFMVSSV